MGERLDINVIKATVKHSNDLRDSIQENDRSFQKIGHAKHMLQAQTHLVRVTFRVACDGVRLCLRNNGRPLCLRRLLVHKRPKT